jgi:hypothetical protein
MTGWLADAHGNTLEACLDLTLFSKNVTRTQAVVTLNCSEAATITAAKMSLQGGVTTLLQGRVSLPLACCDIKTPGSF